VEDENMDAGQRDLVTDEELYAGFESKEEGLALEKEAKEKYGAELVEESNRRVRKMTKNEWKVVRAESEEIYAAFAALADERPEDPEVREVVRRHWAHIERFYPVTREIYEGLAQMYVQDDRFRAFFDGYRKGLADFVAEAMTRYAEAR
jgi:hypothetical protein